MIDCWVSNKNTKVKLSNCWEDILVKKWVSWGTGRVKLNTRVRIWYMKERSLKTNNVQIIYYNRSKSIMAILLILTLFNFTKSTNLNLSFLGSGSSPVHVSDWRRQSESEPSNTVIKGLDLLKDTVLEKLNYLREESLSRFKLLIFQMYGPDLDCFL